MNFSVCVCQLVYARPGPHSIQNSAHSHQVLSANTSRYLYKQLQDAICLHLCRLLENNHAALVFEKSFSACQAAESKIFDSDDKRWCEPSLYCKCKCYFLHHTACGGPWLIPRHVTVIDYHHSWCWVLLCGLKAGICCVIMVAVYITASKFEKTEKQMNNKW